MSIDQILTGIGLVGIGGLLKSFFDFLVANQKLKNDAKQSTKEIRYKAIILMCYALVNYDKEKTTLIINRPDIDSKERLKNEISIEFINMSLFGSDNVIITMKKFISKPEPKTLNNLAIAMRKDLYGIRTKLNQNHFNIKEII
ncbi:hypothetical protein [Elizabethkingia anophelis]|uniref:hypothetical protein n=1 Tax=Elizabethkingia anophelis TaxID=1117645 RepID=UPI000994D57E|nr:hypothetical protein [Elizabethkingia anophelis]AQW95023.1 hypothetical protein BBD30_12975 [Elizabethkingia anophelis]MCW2462239.1 hypothetical protein [Elizabethkingia anophelis]MCW2465923.1 hypothetical protein [Elizabethkingia anophelis]MCW2469608.1 hypothetical protein [Elizabethkingia anophelis]MDV3661860.1 hypothetical protein [Elizabethkingia anophelis]